MVLEGPFQDIYALAHRQNVPLQVFSGETTPILAIGSPIRRDYCLIGVAEKNTTRDTSDSSYFISAWYS